MSQPINVRNIADELSGLPREECLERLRGVIETLSLAERFELLHLLGVYHHPKSVSGAGSTLKETRNLRRELPKLIREEKVRSILDIPCGDFHWMKLSPLDQVEYTGADVVPEIVGANQRLYGRAQYRFVLLDATTDPLPRVDLIICRDLLIHLSLKDIASALRNFIASGSSLVLASHFASRTGNPEILSGDFRPINLCRSPFHLPEPLLIIFEGSELAGNEFQDRAMALWRISDIEECAL